MRLLRTLLYFILLFSSVIAFGQKQRLQFRRIGTNEGLSQSNVFCILKDSRGFMWFGTRDGLNRYDGYRFIVYKHENGKPGTIADNYISSITEDNSGNLWIATGGGLSKYIRNKDQFVNFKNNPTDKNSLSNDFINSVILDKQGNVWAGSESGLNMLDTAKKQFTRYKNNPDDKNSISDNFITNLFIDSKNNFWIGTQNGGLNLFNPKTKTFTCFKHDEKNPGSIALNNINTIFEDSRHRLWVGTYGGGLDLFEKEQGSFVHYQHNDKTNSLSSNAVFAINEDDNHKLWIGTEDAGLTIFDTETGTFDHYQNDAIDNTSISNNSIFSIYKGVKNSMWVGTYNAGINLVNRETNSFNLYRHMLSPNSLSNNNVVSMFTDAKKNIWIGTNGGGLNMFDPSTGNFTHYKHEQNNTNSIAGDDVISIAGDSKGNIWIGTWGNGITVINPSGNSFRHFKNDKNNPTSLSNNNVAAIFEDREKNIWIGTYGGGINVYNPADNSFTHYQHREGDATALSSNYVQYFLQDSEGKLWISTDGGGLNLFNKANKSFTHFSHNDNTNSIAGNSATGICEDRNKNLWIGTSTGLSFWERRTGKFKNYTTADGLPNSTIFAIGEDAKGMLWISTNRGISCYNPVKNIFKNYTNSDGLQSNEFKINAFCRGTDGALYFGGNNGFNKFYTDSIKPVLYNPPLAFTNLRLHNKDASIAIDEKDKSPLKQNITETKSITLSYKNTYITFEFASLNFVPNEKKQYAFIMEGYEDSWNEIGTRRTATYASLSPGEYTFKVKAMNNMGEWSPNIISMKVIVTPPFWLTWWFKTLIFLAIAGAILAFYYFRIQIVQSQKKALERRVKMQTAQLLHMNDEEHRARIEAEKAHAESDRAREEADRANKELERKNKELEQFAYVASHDLQEPLRTSASYVKLIQKQYKGQLDEKADKYFDYIVDSSERMKVLIKDLLDFSRIGVKGELEKVDCNKILKDVLADLDIAIHDSSAEIRSELLPIINGHPTEIKQLFQNLIINAIKFRKKEEAPRINISVLKIHGYWQFAVSDNGIGIDKQHNDKIFIIFQRLHNRSEYKGSGIGLSHCKKIVELHHGKIWVKSTPGKGSTFYFTLAAEHVDVQNNMIVENVIIE